MPDYALQITHKMGPDVMINVPVYEDDADLMGGEVEAKLGLVFTKAQLIADTQAELNARGAVAGLLGGRVISGPTEGAPGAAATGNPMAPVCDCGIPRKYKEGTSKASGNPYKGWFCVQNVCKPDFRK